MGVMAMSRLTAPFPWFGGKSKVAEEVWKRFGDVPNYVEPFAGSLAVLLGRPHLPKTETVNDKDGFIANFWRALQREPDEVARWADNPVNENDLHARHVWLVNRRDELQARLEGDPDYYDVKIAGWWVWGISCSIGGWCSETGSWYSVDGKLTYIDKVGSSVNVGHGVQRRRVHLGNTGVGICRRSIHQGNNHADLQQLHTDDVQLGIRRRRPHIAGFSRGVCRKSIHVLDSDMGWQGQCERSRNNLIAYMRALADRLRLVRVCCGDWERVCGPAPTFKQGLTGVFLDPPYSKESGRTMTLYGRYDDGDIAHRVREWCVRNGDNPLLRIALCGYEGEHNELERLGWSVFAWKAPGGFGNMSDSDDSPSKLNATRERIWFSPHCLHTNLKLFE